LQECSISSGLATRFSDVNGVFRPFIVDPNAVPDLLSGDREALPRPSVVGGRRRWVGACGRVQSTATGLGAVTRFSFQKSRPKKIMRNLAELNINEGGKAVERPAPSREDIVEFEQAFGVSLPPGLSFLLQASNGGHPEFDAVGGPDGHYAVNSFYHLIASDKGTESIWYAMTHWRPILGDHAVPFANTGGGDQFFIDLSNNPPSVKLCRHDEGMRLIEVAPSFEVFIDELSFDPDMI